MAQPTGTQPFKQYNRGRRVQAVEPSFLRGMKSVTSPLGQGLVHTLVNYNIRGDIDAIRPRGGLRPIRVTIPFSLPKSKEDFYDWSKVPAKTVYYSSEQIEEDESRSTVALVGNILAPEFQPQQYAAKNMVVGACNLYTVIKNNSTVEMPIGETAMEKIEPLSDYLFLFRVPNKIEIHMEEGSNPYGAAELIGDELSIDGLKKLYCLAIRKEHTEEVQTSTGTETVTIPEHTVILFLKWDINRAIYTMEELEPYETTAYNMSLGMVNMLMDNPYDFKNRYDAPSLQLNGIYTTDINTGKYTQTTYENTLYRYNLNYSVNKGGKYKIIWSWREPNGNEFDILDVQYVEFTEDTPRDIYIEWASPYTAAIMKIEVFPYENTQDVVDISYFTDAAPAGPVEGMKYYSPVVNKIYEYSGGVWKEPVYPVTSKVYRRLDEVPPVGGKLYRWGYADQGASGGLVMNTYDGYSNLSSGVMTLNGTYGSQNTEPSQNLDLNVNYDLQSCRGMVSWRQRMVLFSPFNGHNMLFISEPNNPAYYPFPRNTLLMNSEIVAVVPYLEDILVFTTDSIWKISLDATGDGWIERCIQRNIRIDINDRHLVKVIRNMVFFKSNNYYYMIVPSSKTPESVVVAPISEPMKDFFDHFTESVDELLYQVYDDYVERELQYYKNIVTYNNIYNLYVYTSKRGKVFTLWINYDIESRAWYTYVIEGEFPISVYKIDITGNNEFVMPTRMNINYLDLVQDDGTIPAGSFEGLQFMMFDNVGQDAHDFYYISEWIREYDFNVEPTNLVELPFRENAFYRNFNYIDTGYRDIIPDLKKRWREIQFKINNFAQIDIYYFTEFWTDGHRRQIDATYELTKTMDPDDPRFGVLSFDRHYYEEHTDPTTKFEVETETDELGRIRVTKAEEAPLHPLHAKLTPGSTKLGTVELIPSEWDADGNPINWDHNDTEKEIDRYFWKLDKSEFPEVVFYKVRWRVSGKGYVPRLKIVNRDENMYEIMDYTWVYRQMYSR